MRLHVVALGCQMSVADGGELAQPLIARGMRPVAEPKDADVIIINTCTVRQHAEDKALSLIGRLKTWKDENPARILIVAGCAAERLGGRLSKRFPHVDLVVGAKVIDDYPRLVEEALAARFDLIVQRRGNFAAPGVPFGWTSPVCAQVTVMRGCNFSCSYCIVPAVRGRESYRAPEAVLAEVRAKTEAGAREIMLLGQTVNSWRRRDAAGRKRRFADLLRDVAAVPGVLRVRFESPHPHFVDDALISAMAEVPQVCGHLHLPLQSGSDRLLGLMRRNGSTASFFEKARRLRSALPEIELSTDIIIGFPSETDDDFQRTLEAVERLRPAWAYTFKYSPREGTEAAGRPDDVPPEVKEERLARLNALCDGLNEKAMRSRVGRVVKILDETGGYGRARDGFRVKWGTPAAPGREFRVRVTGASKRTLLGECHER
ncbi:MAG: tRNA (N6-isopentenyl adenosine(37)-C2)-methylthiotransferase MiaB [Elusimicrobia bacterium GWC2_65_9]|nr:MAG: tRNA (N6-isopentenyl adenosine(37)-C2)-methylthiotransferase MiaB [Elusimicrobia bacterium GWA2_66_18]OGR70745.1 MAG: tRNA (N6-isopentenyl adenosine(37)-C2)-methylthiotransferase MiaB [Elusimicrobia bacterium GWC2_65_9]